MVKTIIYEPMTTITDLIIAIIAFYFIKHEVKTQKFSDFSSIIFKNKQL